MASSVEQLDSAQSLSTRPGMLSGPEALHGVIPLRDRLRLSGDGVSIWSPGGGGGLLCRGAVQYTHAIIVLIFLLFNALSDRQD